MDANRLQELMEARLPGTADLAAQFDASDLELLRAAANDPLLAAEMDRLAAWDASLSSAFDDVPVPVGLQARLLQSVTAEQNVTAAVVSSVTTEPTVQPAVPATVANVSRRRWLTLAMSLSAALLLVVGVSYWSLSPRQIASDALLEETRAAVLNGNDADWNSNLALAPRDIYRFDQATINAAPRRWRNLSLQHDRSAVAYDLAGPGRKTALLVVLNAEHLQSDLSAFPGLPQSSTGGFCLGAWQRDGLIYLLVVEGPERRYQSFVKELSTG
ncbi:MAG TPA: hypothetical protein VL096_10715 [Pirellulaceae bacterium]|nr:hypothetical protein [Pirellulaceae bacterium]